MWGSCHLLFLALLQIVCCQCGFLPSWWQRAQRRRLWEFQHFLMRLYLSKGGGEANAPPLPVHLSSLPRPICQPVKQRCARNSSLRINGHIFYSSWGSRCTLQILTAIRHIFWCQIFNKKRCLKYWTKFFVTDVVSYIGQHLYLILAKRILTYWTNIILIYIRSLQSRSLLSFADCLYSTCWEYESAEAEKVKRIHLNYTRFSGDSCIAFDQRPEFDHW